MRESAVLTGVDHWVELARGARKEGRLADAAELYAFVAGKYEEAEAPRKAGHARRHAAELWMEAGEVGKAREAIAAVMAVYEMERDIPQLERANALRVKALVAEKAGDVWEAKDAWAQAKELYAAEKVQAGVGEAERRLACL